MFRAALPLCIISICSCLSAHNPPSGSAAASPFADFIAGDHWVTHPRNGNITVIGIAGRTWNRDEAIADALADAARKISLYYGVSGESVTVLNIAQNTLDYFSAADCRLTVHHEPEEYAESLIFDRETDVLEMNGSVYVRVRHGAAPDIVFSGGTPAGGVPRWAREQRAEITGWLTGVGSSKNKGSPQKTYRASYENAIAAMLPLISTRVETSTVETDNGIKITQNTAYSKGTVFNVLILETFFDKSTGVLWTLAAAKEG